MSQTNEGTSKPVGSYPSSPSIEEVREQLEEFALHLKPGTTKGKHRTAIFDTLELAQLVKALIDRTNTQARIDELKQLRAKWSSDKPMAMMYVPGSPDALVIDRIHELEALSQEQKEV